MKNKEKYAKEIVEIACNGDMFALTELGKIIPCSEISCINCMFNRDALMSCSEKTKEWAESEYIEKPVISKKDRALLDYIKNNFVYIARDEDGILFVYGEKPIKKSYYYDSIGGVTGSVGFVFDIKLPIVKWEDPEPWLIEDLKKLEVCEEYETD